MENNIYEASTKISKRKNSFFSHLKKGQQAQNMTYLQQKDNLTKIQVKYKNKDLVVQFLMVDMFSENSKKNPLVLIMVQDVWQELYFKKVQDLQRDKMKIFGSLSHELRTPLNCSISMLEVLRDEIYEKNPDYVDEYLNPALFSNKLLLNQINDILDFVQMDSGKFKYSFFEFNIQNLMKDCIKLVSMQAQMKNIQLYTKCDPKIPEIICSDPNRIRQIILNFLSNSLKFTKQGFIEAGIELVQNDIYKLYVRDSGIGISESNLNNLFAFCGKINYSKQDESLNRQGCGLGLTISNSIAKDLVNKQDVEGGVRVQSKYGEGSTFSILIQDRSENNKTQDKKDIISFMNNELNLKQLKEINNKIENEEKVKSFFISQTENTPPPYSRMKSDCYSNNRSPSRYYNQSNPIIGQQSSVSEIIPDIHDLDLKQNYSGFNDQRSLSQIISNVIEKYDSATVVEDDYQNKFDINPEIRIKHSQWLQQDINVTKNKLSSKQKNSQIHSEFQDNQKIHDRSILNGKSDSHNCDNTSNESSLRQIEGSYRTLGQEEIQSKLQQTMTSIEKKQKKCCSQKGGCQQNMKSIISIKNNLADTETKSFLEQEGFTSYITFNNKKLENGASSQTIQNSVSGFDKQRQQVMLMRNQTIKQQSQTSIAHAQNFQDTQQIDEKKTNLGFSQTFENQLNEIINYNVNQKKDCSCPQILIVDDNQFNLYALSKIIKQFQFSCQSISDSTDVINQIKDLYYQNCCMKPKIIFMDIEMPQKNGYQVALEIHQFYNEVGHRELPVIIACTAYIGQEDKEKALQSGMDDFINKPILKSAFIQLLLNWQHLFL